MYGYIYLTTNLVNNKKYIGQHRSSTFDRSYFGSGILINKAIEKYGIENFKCEILKECFSDEELNLSEKEFIEKFDASNSDEFYNIARGGLGHVCDPWNKRKHGTVSEKSLEAWKKCQHLPASEKQKKTLSEIRKNILVSKETREKLSKAQKDKICVNNGEINKYINKESLDEFLSNGWIKGMITSNRKNFYDKFINTKYSEENKYKLENWKSNLSKAFSGRIWVSNGFNSKQIKPEEIDNYISNGWHKGRK